MTDIASLGIKVTTDGVTQAQADLEKLAASGTKAAASTDKLAQANANAAKKYASPQYRQQADDLAKLIGQIDPTVAALDKLDKQQAKLATFKKSGLLSAADFKTYSAAIDEARVKVGSASQAVEKFTLNNSFARRELGRLVNDVANGNWGRFEQTTLTLANASGLMSMAFSATGAAIAGAAVAIGAFVVAAVKGRQETDAYNKALILTGDYAGTTAGHLKDMAEAMAKGSTTEHDAAQVLAAVAASGKFAGQQIAQVGQAALDMAKLTGQSTAETIKQFTSLQDEPVKAVLKLNESEHFLTEATYERIKALQEAGNVEEASSVAMKARSESLAERAKEVQNDAGLMERAWGKVAGAAKGAWDAMLDIGRQQSRGDQAQAIQDKIEQLKGGRFLPNGEFQQGLSENSAQVQAFRKQISDLYDAEAKEAKEARQKSLADQAVQAAADSDADAAVYRTREQKRVDEIKEAHGKANAEVEKALAAGDKATAERIRSNEASIVAGINEKYKARNPRKQADPMAALDKLTEQAYAKALEDTNKPLNERAAALLKIADAGGKAIAKGADVAAVQAKVAHAVDQTNAYFDKQAALLLEKNAVAMAKYQLALDEANQALERQVDAQIAHISESDKEYERQQQINDLYVKGADALRKLQAERAQPGANLQLLDQQIAAQQANTDKQVRIVQDGYAQMDKAQADWTNGARRAYKSYVDQASDVAGQTADLFTNAFDGLGQALADFATTGKLNFKELANSIISDLVRIEARILISQALQSMFGGGATYGGGSGAATGTGQYSDFGSSGTITKTYNALGGVYASSSLSAYSGQIVDRPTMFAFAKGAGLMGEAGPEAILPLQRGSDGRLGVASSGGGSGDVQVEVNVTNNGQAVQARQTGVRQDGQKVIVDMVLDAVASDMASGGRTAKAAQQRFGLQRRGVPVSGG